MIRRLGLFVPLLLMASRVPAAASAQQPRAPIVASDRWFNSRPLTAADLSGKVVVVEFWTFGCINCVRTVPALRALHASFPRSEVVVLGVHTPEFERERRASEVARAIERLGVAYPVALDNDYKNWRAYGNQYWPALYVVDRRGVIRYSHVGELHEGTSSWRELLAVIERLRREPVSHVSSGSRKEGSTWQG